MSFDQSNFRLKSDGAAGAQPGQNKLQEEATEHTIAGSVIGAVRNIVPGIKGSAQSNDQIAHIAADTIASLPMVKTLAGGGIRATMLIDPTKDWGANAGSFGVNFVEGVALNKVSKMAMPGSSFTEFVSSKLGTGLASEAATHLTVGLGFGAIRTGFNSDSWKDNQGNFSLTSGAENLVKGSAMGALINLPAGMIGFRVARASSVALENSAISPRIASVISGIGSGYAAGGVFGGADAVMAGKSFTDVLKGINEGGIIGAASGGLMGSLQGSRVIDSPANPKSVNVSETLGGASFHVKPLAGESANVPMERLAANTEIPLAGKNREPLESSTYKPKEVFYPANDEHFVLGSERYEALTIKPREIPRVQEVEHRLTSSEVKSESYTYLDPKAVGPFKDFEHFATHLKTGVQDFRVYQVDSGKTEIALPESYARKLDDVRALRIKAEQPSPLDDLLPGQHLAVQNMVKANDVETFRSYFNEEQTRQVLPVIHARIALGQHPLGNRALPEDFVSLMNELPTTNNIKRLTIWDERSSYDQWHAQEHDMPDFKAAATAQQSAGKVDFFQTNKSDAVNSPFQERIRGSLFHEHSHLVVPRDNMYEEASLLEKDGYYSTKYSSKNNDERWAEDRAKAFLHPDPDKFFEFAQEAPLRSVVIAHELRRQLEAAPTADQGIYSREMWERVKFTEEQVLPYARRELVENLRTGDQRTQAAAVRLLEQFGSKSEIDALLKSAGNTSGDATVRQKALDLAMQLHSQDRVNQFDFVWQKAVENPGLSDLAVKRLRSFGVTDERASSYANLLEIISKKDLPSLAKQVTRMQTDEGSNLAYDFAMNMGRTVQGYQRAVAISALQEVPSLRLKALGTLANQPPEYIAQVVKKFVNDENPEIAEAARHVMKGVELRNAIQNANHLLDNGGTVKPELLGVLGDSGNVKAVPTLLQIMLRGPEASRSQAASELAKFNPNIVKFYERSAKQRVMAGQMQ